jgi:2,4-dienoyl-CoA reductase-like NADH-dependent reductase (Old Yellow Enzyme family)
MCFSLEVLEAIRGAVGRDFIVGARVSGDDWLPDGLGPDELLEIISRLDWTGRLDYFTVTGGTISTVRSRGYNIPSATMVRAPLCRWRRRSRRPCERRSSSPGGSSRHRRPRRCCAAARPTWWG